MFKQKTNTWTTQLEIRRWLERIKHFELSDTEVLENQYMVFYQSRSLSIKAVICVVSDPCFSITRLEAFFPLTTIKPPSAATAPAGKQSPAALLMYCGTWMISLRAMQRAGRWKLALVPSRQEMRRGVWVNGSKHTLASGLDSVFHVLVFLDVSGVPEAPSLHIIKWDRPP